MKLLTNWILPLLFYSGPLLPTVALFYLRSVSGVMHFKKTVTTLLIIHVAAFIPFAVASILHYPDSLHLLLFPALTGVLSLATSMVVSIVAAVRIKRNGKQASEPGGGE